MNTDKPVRFGNTKWDRVTGLRLCEHITLPNAYHPERGGSEYASGIQIHCEQCDETFKVTELIN
jgi:hypothetical protein